MNKTILIAGGASVASLAAGGAAGYFIAKRQFDKTTDQIVEREVNATKKYFSVLLEQARSGKPANPMDVPISEDEADDEDLELEGEDPEEQEEALEEARTKASRAMINYQGFGDKPSDNGTVTNNIFNNPSNGKKPTLPPRNPKDGKFVKKEDAELEETPYLIDEDAFLANDHDDEACNLLYFVDDETLIDVESDGAVVENGIIGAANLTLFPEPDENGASAIYVRNERMGRIYDVRLATMSLTEFSGMDDFQTI